MMISERESEVLLGNLLNRFRNVVVDVRDMRELFNEVKELEKLIVMCGKNKCGKNNCKLLYNREIEIRLINVMIMWDKIKVGL